MLNTHTEAHNKRHSSCLLYNHSTPKPGRRRETWAAQGPQLRNRPARRPRSGSGSGVGPAGICNGTGGKVGLPKLTRWTSGCPSRLSPQLFVDTLAGLFGRGHHRGSRRALVLQDPLDGPVRGRRGRHCLLLRRSAQRRCLAPSSGRKGLGASRNSPGSRRARLGLKRPHLLSGDSHQSCCHDTTTRTLWRLADAAWLAALREPLATGTLTAARGEKPA